MTQRPAGKGLSGYRIRWSGIPYTLILGGAVILYLTALFSYSPLDESPVTITIPPAAPVNKAGLLGAWVSGFTMYFFGYVAWLLPLPVLHLVIRCQFSSEKKTPCFVSVCSLYMMLFMAFLLVPGLLSEIPEHPARFSGALSTWLTISLQEGVGETGYRIMTALFLISPLQFLYPALVRTARAAFSQAFKRRAG